MFRTLIYPSSGACDCAAELPHRSFCSAKMEDLALVKIYGVWWCVFGVMCFVVLGRCIFIDIDHYLLCFMITVFSCVEYVSLVDW